MELQLDLYVTRSNSGLKLELSLVVTQLEDSALECQER